MRHIAVFCCLLLACSIVNAAPERPPTPVFFTSVASTRLQMPLTLYGRLSAAQSLALSPSVTDTLSAIHVKDGQQVKAGDILFELTKQEEQAQLHQARAQLKEVQEQFVRAETLLKAKLSSQEAYGSKRTALEDAQGQLAAVEARLADRFIRAPFDGRFGLKPVNLGDLVRPGDTLGQIEGQDIFHLDIEVPQSQTQFVTQGSPFEAISLDDSRKTSASINALDNRLQPTTLTLLARANIGGKDWIAGERVKVIILRNLEGLTLPEGALVQEGTQSFVFRVETDNTVSRQQVVVKARAQGQVIIEGLNSGDKIVTQGTAKLTHKARVSLAGEDKGQPLHDLLPGSKN